MKKQIKINFVITIFVLFNITLLEAQTEKYLFERITVTEGLSQNNASDVVQDDFGFIWVGTEDAINRYDGYEIKIFKTNPGDTNSIAPGRISKLFCDSKGNLWVGAGINLSRFNHNTQQFINYPTENFIPESNTRTDIIALQEDKENNIWFASQGGILGYYSSKGDSLVYLNNLLPGENETKFDRINFMQFIKGERLWVGFDNGLSVFDLVYSNHEVEKLIEIKLLKNNITNPSAVYEDINGNIWIGTWRNGFYRYDLNTGKLESIILHNSPYQFSDFGISSIISNSEGDLFIGTDGLETFGLIKYNPAENTAINILHDPKDENSLSGNRIASLLIDRSGILWVGTWNRGLNKLNEASNKFNLVSPLTDDQNSLSSGFIRGFYEDSNNILWILTSGGGLNRFDPLSGTFDIFVSDRDDPEHNQQ